MKSLPALFVITQVALPAYDWLLPWELGVAQLSSMGAVARLCVGARSSTAIGADGAQARKQVRTYIVVRSGEFAPRVITVAGIRGVTISSTITGPFGFLAWLAALGACWYLVWRWWIRPYRAGGLEGLRLAI